MTTQSFAKTFKKSAMLNLERNKQVSGIAHLSLATKSDESWAALTDKVLGMTNRDFAKSAIATWLLMITESNLIIISKLLSVIINKVIKYSRIINKKLQSFFPQKRNTFLSSK